MGKKDRAKDKGRVSSRRDFLALAGNLGVCACGLAAAGLGARLAVPELRDGPPHKFPVGPAADFVSGTLTWIRDREIFIVHDGDGFGAFSSRCTHLGCTVKRSTEGFYCPCHGASYDGQGRVMTGPARKDLPWYLTWVGSGGRVWVDTDQVVECGRKNANKERVTGRDDEES